MTSTEMRDLLFLKFDNLLESGAPDYADTQIDPILSNAQRRLVRNIDKGFDYNERLKKYLAPLLAGASISGGDIIESENQDGVYPGGILYDLPLDLWYIKSELAILVGASEYIEVKPKTHDFYSANVKNPYKKPNSEVVWRFDFGNSVGPIRDDYKRVELITDSTDIDNYSIKYTVQLPDITIGSADCILHEDLHDLVVDEAYKMLTAATKQDEYQIASNESKNQ